MCLKAYLNQSYPKNKSWHSQSGSLAQVQTQFCSNPGCRYHFPPAELLPWDNDAAVLLETRSPHMVTSGQLRDVTSLLKSPPPLEKCLQQRVQLWLTQFIDLETLQQPSGAHLTAFLGLRIRFTWTLSAFLFTRSGTFTERRGRLICRSLLWSLFSWHGLVCSLQCVCT